MISIEDYRRLSLLEISLLPEFLPVDAKVTKGPHPKTGEIFVLIDWSDGRKECYSTLDIERIL